MTKRTVRKYVEPPAIAEQTGRQTPLALWGGIECTVNRVGDRFRDQTALSGHDDRPDDIELFATLGIEALRYPVLWERTAPDRADALDWTRSDERLGRLRTAGIRPIVGLVHHGSGPRRTDLLDPGFAAGLGRYAAEVATRYPWVEDWTPINEPLTTARFSALYGHWYPHHRDERSFWLALLNQVDATRAAMRAIRRINPAARLIQTDDLGRTSSTPKLAHQARFDNMRRWAGWDLLFGCVTPGDPLGEELDRLGFGDRVRRIADDPCPPDIVGVNHYLTSDRFLDHRSERYPSHMRGTDDRVAYVDVEAIRVLDPPTGGLGNALREAWQRYGTPLAITEVHNGCTREEQMRWTVEAWDTATALRHDGVDIRAVTAWSLLGSRGWNTLLTADGLYEPGLYDVSMGAPRPTGLAALWKGLPGGAPRHPVAEDDGWWRRPDRLLHPPHRTDDPPAGRIRRRRAVPAPLLICGATGTLGSAFVRACDARGIEYVALDRASLDLDTRDPADVLAAIRPWGVVNAAGWVRVDDAEDAEDACRRVNAAGAIALAEACAAIRIPCLNFSSDLVFDGSASRALVERDQPRPLNAYGRSKAEMEGGCRALPGSLIVRTAAFFSPHDRFNFAVAVADALAAGNGFRAAGDQIVTPTFVPRLVEGALDLLIDGAEGIWHLSDGEAVTWAEFARRVARGCGYDAGRIEAVSGLDLGLRAARPAHAALFSERSALPGSLAEGIDRFAHARRHGTGGCRAFG